MERVRWIGETRGPVTAGLGFVEMRVEHDLCAVPGGPADRFRIAPTFMANGDSECQRAGLEKAQTLRGHSTLPHAGTWEVISMPVYGTDNTSIWILNCGVSGRTESEAE